MALLDYKSVGILVVAAFVLLFVVNRKATEAIGKGLKYVDVTSDTNLAAQLSNKTTAALTGGQDKTLGGFWYRKCKAADFLPWYCPKV